MIISKRILFPTIKARNDACQFATPHHVDHCVRRAIAFSQASAPPASPKDREDPLSIADILVVILGEPRRHPVDSRLPFAVGDGAVR